MTHFTPEFQGFIRSTLRARTPLNEAQVLLLTDDSGTTEFARCFTSKLLDPDFHYEFYEMMGDATTNKVVVWYFQRRFPDLFDPRKAAGQGNMSPVAIMARLKMNGISKRTYARFSRHLGFDQWVRLPDAVSPDSLSRALANGSTPVPTPAHKNDSVCEDVFEAFVGCLEFLLDSRIGPHVGYAICYEWMKHVMDECCKDVHMERESLYDRRSLLNEKKSEWGSELDVRIESQDIRAQSADSGEARIASGHHRFRARYVILVRKVGLPCREVPTPWCSGLTKKEAQEKSAGCVIDNKWCERVADQYSLTKRVKPPPGDAAPHSSARTKPSATTAACVRARPGLSERWSDASRPRSP